MQHHALQILLVAKQYHTRHYDGSAQDRPVVIFFSPAKPQYRFDTDPQLYTRMVSGEPGRALNDTKNSEKGTMGN